MQVENAVFPDSRQLQEFTEPGPDGPIYMVNLLKFRTQARYPDGRETQLTGRAAYELYAERVAVLLEQFGGRFAFAGEVSRLMLGTVEELWDEVAIAMYPSRAAMLQMMTSPEMQEIGVHRTAGLAGQLNIETHAARGHWVE